MTDAPKSEVETGLTDEQIEVIAIAYNRQPNTSRALHYDTALEFGRMVVAEVTRRSALPSAAPNPNTSGGPTERTGPWRCFHCDENFTDQKSAQDHFGPSEYDKPICQMDANYIRWLMGQHRRNVDDDSEALRTVGGMVGEHEKLRRQAEELGYARGLAAAKKYPAELGLTALPAAVPEVKLCMCKDRPAGNCPGEWEPGCDLGNNPRYVRAAAPDAPEAPVNDARLALAAERAKSNALRDALTHLEGSMMDISVQRQHMLLGIRRALAAAPDAPAAQPGFAELLSAAKLTLATFNTLGLSMPEDVGDALVVAIRNALAVQPMEPSHD